jgi:hypothetical protein
MGILKRCKKGNLWVSAIIYTLVAVFTVTLILNTGVPLLSEMKDRSVFEKVKEIMLEVDGQFTDLASQGEGSQSRLGLDIKEGEVSISDNEIIWEIETKQALMSPRSSTTLGNLIVASNANVNTIELDDYYIMQTRMKNDTFTVVINRHGTEAGWTFFNTSQIIENISYNGEDMGGSFIFSIGEIANSTNGTGYITMYPSGNHSHLGSAKVIAHINSTFAEYDLEFSLESYADFLTTRLINVNLK